MLANQGHFEKEDHHLNRLIEAVLIMMVWGSNPTNNHLKTLNTVQEWGRHWERTLDCFGGAVGDCWWTVWGSFLLKSKS